SDFAGKPIEPEALSTARPLSHGVGIKSHWLLFLALFLTGGLLRVSLSWVNTEANDDHLTVIREILTHGWTSPGREACWECYHAKLYHYAAATTYFALGIPVTPATAYVANGVSAIAGLGTLWLLLMGARSTFGSCSWNPATRLAGYAFFALWPALTVI